MNYSRRHPALPLLTLILLASFNAHAQSADHIQRCIDLRKQGADALTKAWNNADEYDYPTGAVIKRGDEAERRRQFERVVAIQRELLSVCRDLLREDSYQEALALHKLGRGLYGLEKFDDAVTIFKRCTAVKPDAAFCFYEMGITFLALRQRQEAVDAFKRAIAIGGYDNMNADFIDMAKTVLDVMEHSGDQIREPDITAGSGFFVNGRGYLLTNAHVISECKRIQIRDGEPLHLVTANEEIDLALLKTEITKDDERRPAPAFRTSLPRVGEAVIAFGFPLPQLLSAEGNLSTGNVAAISGLRGDPRFIQVSAPVQRGNSGGPLLDASGNVIGIVVAKLDAIKIAQLTGDIPQNVNFAIRSSEVIRFLTANLIDFNVAAAHAAELQTSVIAERARKFTVAIECIK